MKHSAIQGGILVAIGATSYGVLTTFVKLANKAGFTTFELTFSQYLVGAVVLIIVDFLFSKSQKNAPVASFKNIRNLFLAGTTLGLTSLLYYFSVQFISVSIAIVLLMQSVWIGVAIDALVNKTKPGKLKIIAVVIVLIGTVLATNLLFEADQADWRGFGLGFLAAISYSITIFAANDIAIELPAVKRSKWLTLGGLAVVIIISLPFITSTFHPAVLYKWGIILAVFGTVLAPLLLASGMPKVNLGIGAIITALELPVAVLMGHFILGEPVNVYQWTGVVLIFIAVVVMNLRKIIAPKPTH